MSSTNEIYPAKEVILSAGTYGSAAILGQHLQDQPIFYNAYALSNNASK